MRRGFIIEDVDKEKSNLFKELIHINKGETFIKKKKILKNIKFLLDTREKIISNTREIIISKTIYFH